MGKVFDSLSPEQGAEREEPAALFCRCWKEGVQVISDVTLGSVQISAHQTSVTIDEGSGDTGMLLGETTVLPVTDSISNDSDIYTLHQ